MRKRIKKKIVASIDEDGMFRNCYGEPILWTKRELKRAKVKARKLAKLLQWC